MCIRNCQHCWWLIVATNGFLSLKMDRPPRSLHPLGLECLRTHERLFKDFTAQLTAYEAGGDRHRLGRWLRDNVRLPALSEVAAETGITVEPDDTLMDIISCVLFYVDSGTKLRPEEVPPGLRVTNALRRAYSEEVEEEGNYGKRVKEQQDENNLEASEAISLGQQHIMKQMLDWTSEMTAVNKEAFEKVTQLCAPGQNDEEWKKKLLECVKDAQRQNETLASEFIKDTQNFIFKLFDYSCKKSQEVPSRELQSAQAGLMMIAENIEECNVAVSMSRGAGEAEQALAQLEDDENMARNKYECLLCFQENPTVVMTSCGHQILCNLCAPPIKKCIICNIESGTFDLGKIKKI